MFTGNQQFVLGSNSFFSGKDLDRNDVSRQPTDAILVDYNHTPQQARIARSVSATIKDCIPTLHKAVLRHLLIMSIEIRPQIDRIFIRGQDIRDREYEVHTLNDQPLPGESIVVPSHNLTSDLFPRSALAH
jgi:hypothetical protein